MVLTPYCAVDGSGLLLPPVVNGFHTCGNRLSYLARCVNFKFVGNM